MSTTPIPIRQQIIKLREVDKLSLGQISRITSKSKSVIHGVLNLYKQTKSIEPKKSPGRPRKTTKREDRLMLKVVKKDRFKTAAAISREINDKMDSPISRRTVSRRLNEQNLFARSPITKPLISKKNKRLRLSFAYEHVVWTDKKWKTVHFSDESKFMLMGSDGKNYVRRNIGEQLSEKCLKKSMKFGGGSIMVWGMISGNGVGPLIRLHGKVNAYVYKELLKQHVIPALKHSDNNQPILMQDNAPCHKAKMVMGYFKEKNISLLNWPPQSPDLNPIENVWKIIGERSMAQNPKNLEELWNILQKEWMNMKKEDIEKLIISCGRRCQSVIDVKGGNTKY